MNIGTIITIIDLLLWLIIAANVAYVLFFALASLLPSRKSLHPSCVPSVASEQSSSAPINFQLSPFNSQLSSFLILFPAYHEDNVILHSVESFLLQDYPKDNYHVVVISDHMSPETNDQLSKLPITLLQPSFEHSSKAKALQYAIDNFQFSIFNSQFPDFVVILDADNIVQSDFLTQLNKIATPDQAIQCHRTAKNADNDIAALDGISEEINNNIFRRGHITLGLSSAVNSSGMAYEFDWFKTNIMKVRTNTEEKELEAMLIHQHIYVDYFDDIHVYNERKREAADFNRQRRLWVFDQVRSLVKNIRFLPSAIFNQQYDWVDKIIQWMLLPRTILFIIIFVMSLTLPFIYFSLAIKWWIITVIWGFSLAFATPNELVDKNWDKDFIMLPIATVINIVQKVIDKFKKK